MKLALLLAILLSVGCVEQQAMTLPDGRGCWNYVTKRWYPISYCLNAIKNGERVRVDPPLSLYKELGTNPWIGLQPNLEGSAGPIAPLMEPGAPGPSYCTGLGGGAVLCQ